MTSEDTWTTFIVLFLCRFLSLKASDPFHCNCLKKSNQYNSLFFPFVFCRKKSYGFDTASVSGNNDRFLFICGGLLREGFCMKPWWSCIDLRYQPITLTTIRADITQSLLRVSKCWPVKEMTSMN